ncbi:MAG: hypothetical protein JST40_12930 [Armatimonadetes bacterium]|nr:hypothetical protein [Armatimonadota bacterium]
MHFRVQLLGKFALTNIPSGEAISLRANRRILAYLLIKSPDWVHRGEIIHDLWPDEESSVASNRLRVALNALRTLLGPALIESTDGITLDRDVVECDLLQIRNELRLAEDQVASEALLHDFRKLLPRLRERLFPRETQQWERRASSSWSEMAAQICLQASQLAERFDQDDLVARAAEIGLIHDRESLALWTQYLRGSAMIGRGDQAIQSYVRANRERRLNHESLKSLVQQIRSGRVDAESENILSPDERELAPLILGTLIRSNRKLARQILGAPETLADAGRYPKAMLSLLEKVIDEPEEYDETWERSIARAIGLRAWQKDHQGVLALAPRVIEKSQNPLILRAAWNAVSVAKSIVRDWPGTMEAIEKTIQHATELGDEIDISASYGNKATYLWLQGRYDEALDVFSESQDILCKNDGDRARFEYIIGFGNRAFIPLMQGNYELAKEWFEKALELRREFPGKFPGGLVPPALALTYCLLGEQRSCYGLMRQGLSELFDGSVESYQQVALEYLGASLIVCGDSPLGLGTLEWVNHWRIRTGHIRAKAETDLCESMARRRAPGSKALQLSKQAKPAQIAQMGMVSLRRLTQ